MRDQYIVKENDLNKRREFFNYIVNKYDMILSYPLYEEEIINSHFPFVIDFKYNSFWICNSISCLAAASSAGVVFTIDEFKKLRRD